MIETKILHNYYKETKKSKKYNTIICIKSMQNKMNRMNERWNTVKASAKLNPVFDVF